MGSVQQDERQMEKESIVRSGDGHAKRSLSRSPHPYHRRGPSLIESEQRPPLAKSKAHGNNTREQSPQLSSESGTEADDERGGNFLKRLPAPPLRARKGLRGGTPIDRTPFISPLPSPPIRSAELQRFTSRKPAVGTTCLPDEAEFRRIREKYTKRKKAEIIRRSIEVVLLLLVSLIACSGQHVMSGLREWKREVYSHLFLVVLLYSVYPLRLSYQVYRGKGTLLRSLKAGFRIPSGFDPGTLLYPVFLPMIISISLLSRSSTFILPNLLLGLSSLPRNVTPFHNTDPPFSRIHWAISLIPLVVSQSSPSQLHPPTPFALKINNTSGVKAEQLALVYPLHQSTTTTINFLATTSLDPAELQLLSTALVNVLLFSVAPQSEILKALIWLGGILVFITCQKVLSWEVALARVPSWRFRRRTGQPPPNKPTSQRLDAALCQKLANFSVIGKKGAVSDSDDAGHFDNPPKRLGRLPKLRIDLHQLIDGAAEKQAASAIEPSANGNVWVQNGTSTTNNLTTNSRRHTLSNVYQVSKSEAKTILNGRPRRALTPNASIFLKMTPAQAQVRKWMYALYVYLIVCIIILIPIRSYVSINALSTHEPFGWALGYLLGNIPQFRFWTVATSLERWIILPERIENKVQCQSGWVERIRQDFGPANTRLFLCAYCLAVLLTGIATVLRLTSVVEVDTRRKVFHGIMVAMLLPTVFIDPCFVALALMLILSIFLLLDLFRASQLPPISKPLTYFLAPYVDGRDHRGPVIVSHIFLLIGCAIPLWLSLAGAPRSGVDPWNGWNTNVRDVSMVSGVICVGMGDAAASLIGRRFGRHKWLWPGGKSLEGSLAFAFAVTAGLITSYAWLVIGGWVKHEGRSWLMVAAKAAFAASGASLTEAVLTSCNDNVVVPLVLWLIVRGVGI